MRQLPHGVEPYLVALVGFRVFDLAGIRSRDKKEIYPADMLPAGFAMENNWGLQRRGVEAYIDLLSRFAYEAIGNGFAFLKVSGWYAPLSVFVPRVEAPRQKDLTVTN